MIDLYYWPTPNGHKIPIMLEECGLEYRTHAINIGKDDQFINLFAGMIEMLPVLPVFGPQARLQQPEPLLHVRRDRPPGHAGRQL